MARKAALRASDAEREQVAECLRHATAEGRLLAEELEERLGAALSARTHGELDALTADLPRPQSGRHRRLPLSAPVIAIVIAALIVTLVIAIALVLLLTGFFVVWAFFLAWGWWMFGRRRALERRYRRSWDPSRRWLT